VLARPQAFTSASFTASSPVSSPTSRRNFSSGAEKRSAVVESARGANAAAVGEILGGPPLTARQTAVATLKEIFGGQQSTLSRSAKKVLNAPNIGVQVNSW
jgi:hypothetical protein